MLPTIEKMLLLKSVNLFSRVPDPILFEIASIVKDETVPKDKTIIQKGDIGDFMYIIASGRVRVHDGDQTITDLGENDEFGELALLYFELAALPSRLLRKPTYSASIKTPFMNSFQIIPMCCVGLSKCYLRACGIQPALPRWLAQLHPFLPLKICLSKVRFNLNTLH